MAVRASNRTGRFDDSHAIFMNQITLPHTESTIPPRAGCLPLIKWVGGKRALVPFLSPIIHELLTASHGRYIEPFLGGGALALDLGQPNMMLADCCKPLVTMYQGVKKNPAAVHRLLTELVSEGVDKESYLRVRAIHNETKVSGVLLGAARFLYLSALSFNGLYRENSKGEFNVPWGQNAKGQNQKRRIPSLEEIQAVARALATSEVIVSDFSGLVNRAERGDAIYGDPPYYETFTNYTSNGFMEQDQADLAVTLKLAHERGVYVFASNIDHPRIRELYAWAYITPVTEKHTVGATGARRGAKKAVLIAGHSDYLRQR